ncbi:MAG: Flp pilus assembly complex ATPase component TadA [Polyangiaceae bacterium]|nr:Flp pilus assembly complex ATPase component TadA [Polyangiaceae bacterium]
MQIEVCVQSEHGGSTTRRLSTSGRVVIGRHEDCDVRVPDDAVSRQHAVVFAHANGLRVRDLSSNGTIAGRHVLRGGEEAEIAHGTPIRIGAHRVVIRPAFPAPGASTSDTPSRATHTPTGRAAAEAPVDSKPAAVADVTLRREIHRRLLDYLDLAKLDASKLDDLSTRPRVLAALRAIIDGMQERLPPGADRDALLGELADEALGLGPLERFLADPTVTEIMVIDESTIYIERGGTLVKTGARFTDDERARAVIERIVTPLGRRIDESSPLVDARLKDGSRVNAIIRPLALRGSCITIRKFPGRPLTMDDLIQKGTLDVRMARFLRRCVVARKNVVISGGTGSGKTTLLNVLSAAIPEAERIVTIEDAAELRLKQPHIVSLEARPANMEGKGQYSIRDLVANALRMRPDRIVVGECRGGEALDMLQAMNTGHDGSLTTTHANSPVEAIARLETLCLMSGVALPSRAVREQIAASIDVVVQQTRFADGARRVTEISEVVGIDESGEVELRPLFEFVRSGVDARGTILGDFQVTGYLPSFLHQFIVMSLVRPGEPYL